MEGDYTLQSTEEDGRPIRRASVREPAPAHLFRLLECEHPSQPGARTCLRGVAAVALGRRSSRGADLADLEVHRRVSLFLPDRWMSSTHAQIRRSDDGWVLEDAGSKNGTFVAGARVQRHDLRDGDLIETGHTFFLFRESLPALADAPVHLEGADVRAAAPGLETLLPPLDAEFARLRAVAPSNLPVMLFGETGTGKEVVASALHALSGRRGAFQAVNCGALPAEILESELFGHSKGAFTGAVNDKPGLVRASDGGTLFLDEIGEMPPAAQAKLLRVLEQGEVTPVGTTRPVRVDLRPVVATHRDLQAMVAQGSFRADLYGRLSGLTLRLPPLRERREDLGLLIAALLRRDAPAPDRVAFHPDAARLLLNHAWPLNIRELKKALAASVLLAQGAPVEAAHLPESVRESPRPSSSTTIPPDRFTEKDRARCEQITALLEQHGGNLTAVARDMGKARTQIQRWIKRCGIDASKFRR